MCVCVWGGVKSYAGENPFGKYHICDMHDLVHYLRYIQCLEHVDVSNL